MANPQPLCEPYQPDPDSAICLRYPAAFFTTFQGLDTDWLLTEEEKAAAEEDAGYLQHFDVDYAT